VSFFLLFYNFLDQGIDTMLILKIILQKQSVVMQTAIWLRMRSSGTYVKAVMKVWVAKLRVIC
jgi:hypothetical protein